MTHPQQQLIHVVVGEPMRCGYCGELAREFYSYNPQSTPDICPACYALSAGAVPQQEPQPLRGMLRHLQRTMRTSKWARVHVPRDDGSGFDVFTVEDVEAALAALPAPQERPYAALKGSLRGDETDAEFDAEVQAQFPSDETKKI